MNKSQTIVKSEEEVQLVQNDFSLEVGNDVWTLGFEIVVDSYRTKVSFGLKKGEVLFGYEFMMCKGAEKEFSMLVGKI